MKRNVYGDRLGLLAQARDLLRRWDRHNRTDAWRAAVGPVVAADFYDSETYDARLELDGWSAPGFDDVGARSSHLRRRRRAGVTLARRCAESRRSK